MRAVSTALLVVQHLTASRAVRILRRAEECTTQLKRAARFMGLIVNRILSGGLATAFALLSTLSCSDANAPKGLSTDDLSVDESRVATVSVSLASNSIEVGDTVRATATLRDSANRLLRRTVVWTSSNTAVATVDTTGLVTGRAPGTAIITATRGTKSGSATLTVGATGTSVAPVASVTVTLAKTSVTPGETTQAAATTYDSAGNVLAGRAVAWSSSDNGVASVSAAGVVTAVAAGTSQIIATSEGKSGSAAITVSSAPQPTTAPGTVTDLTAAAADSAGVTLAFTQVNDGTGQPAKYDVRYSVPPIDWGSASSTTNGTCTTPVAGFAIGATLTCRVGGLRPTTKYNFQVIAFRGTLNQNAVFGGLSNIAEGTTTAGTSTPPAPVATVSVSPASATIQVGNSVQLSATTRDANGNTLTGRVITWSSGNAGIASVNSSGLVTAVAAGSTQITATSEGKTGSATITVQSAPPPPPPGGGTLLFSEDFETSNIGSRGWYDNTSVSLSTAEHIAGSTASAQYHWTNGATTPQNGAAQRHKFTASNSVYVSYYVKYSANYVGSGQDYHPHEFYILSTLDGDFDGLSANYMTIYIEQNYLNGGRPVIAMQDNKNINYSQGSLPNNLVSVTENRSTGGCNGMAESNMYSECFGSGTSFYNLKHQMGPVTFQPTAGTGYKNSWNFVEAYVQLNTVTNGKGNADGVMQYWFNGQLIIDRHDILYRTAQRASLQLNQFIIAPYIGDGSPADQYMWVDNLRVATGRIP
jgi:uncharacterized protein YjdB